MYWLVNFKDDMVEQLSKQKPNFSRLRKNMNNQISKNEKINPIKYFYKLTPIANKLIKQDINYYVIQFKIKGNNIPYELLYRIPDIYDDSWKYRKRVDTEHGPCCI